MIERAIPDNVVKLCCSPHWGPCQYGTTSCARTRREWDRKIDEQVRALRHAIRDWALDKIRSQPFF